MNNKAKDCFTPHVMIHSLFGLGLGIVLINLVPGLNNVWLGVGAMAAAVVLDYVRKN